MGALLGLVLGLGLLLVWSSTWPAPVVTESPGRRRAPRLRPLLVGAGLPDVGPGAFLAVCAVTATASATVVLLASRTPPVALVFGVMGGYLPVALLRGRAERRLRELAEVWPEAVDNLASAMWRQVRHHSPASQSSHHVSGWRPSAWASRRVEV